MTSNRQYPLQFLADFARAVIDDEAGELLEYRHLIQRPKYKKDCGYSFGNEIGRLVQGMPGRKEGADTLSFMDKTEIPSKRLKDVVHSRMVCNVRPQKEEVNRIRLTFCGQNSEVPMDCGTPTASVLAIKLLLNSVISTPDARFMAIDINHFYLSTTLDRPGYLRMKLSYFPEDVIEHYKLKEEVYSKGWVYATIVKEMYGLPHAGIIAQKQLEERLNKHGYCQSKYTTGLWKHESRQILFSFILVNDFGVKYAQKEDAQHLLNVLQEHCTISKDLDDKRYNGRTLDWGYICAQDGTSLYVRVC